MSKSINQEKECCNHCAFNNGFNYKHDDNCPCHTPKNESWEEEFAQLVVNGDISKYIPFIKKVEAEAEEKGYEKGFKDGIKTPHYQDYEQGKEQTLEKVRQEIEGMKTDLVAYSKSLPPMARTNRRKNEREKLIRNKALDDVLKIIEK